MPFLLFRILTCPRMLALEEVYDVTMVKDGQEAYDTVKSNMEKGRVFDLIFMDIQVFQVMSFGLEGVANS